MLNILQWNINSITSKRAALIHALKTQDVHIAILQETLSNTPNFKISGFNVFATSRDDNNRGLAILVKNHIPAKMIRNPAFCGDNVEVLAVQIHLLDTQLSIYNIYRQHANDNLNLTQLFTEAELCPTLIAGDFNAHHPILSSVARTTEEGEHIAHLLDEVPGLALLNDGNPTHIRGGRLDLTFINTHLRQYATWKIHSALCQSDHFAIDIQLELPQLPPIPAPPPRWNQELADWTIFQRAMESWAENYAPPEDINQQTLDLEAAFHAAADQAMPKRKQNGNNQAYKDSWYYCPEVRRLKTRMNQARKRFRKNPTDMNRVTMQDVVNYTTERLNQIKLEAWYDWCARLSQHTKLRDTWFSLKRATGTNTRPRTATHPNPQQEAERLAEKFAQRTSSENLPQETRRLQQQLHEQRWNEINRACNTPDDTDAPYTLQELRATYKSGRDTAPGSDRITYTMIKEMGPAGENATLQLINRTHVERIRPRVWNQQDTQPIPKARDPENPRPISLISCIEKTAEKMALKRMQYKTGPLHHKLYAYREGVGTTECINDVLHCINNKAATVIFIDFEKAFELASPAAVLHSLAKRGVRGCLLEWGKLYVLDREARVKFQGHVSEYKRLENGTPQGGILSPFLFNILMENFAVLPLPQGVDMFIFADDVAVVARGPNRLPKAQRALTQVNNKAKELGLKINIQKIKAMAIKSHRPDTQLKIGDTPIQWVNTYTYLGVQLDYQLKFDAEITFLRERAKTRLAPMKYMSSLKAGATIDIQRTYYTACTRSIVEYASPVLCNLTEAQVSKLEVIQNNAMRQMLGAPMWTKIENLQMECNLSPLLTRAQVATINVSAKSLLSNRDCYSTRRLKEDLNKHPEIMRPNTYGTHIGTTIRAYGLQEQLLSLRPDAIIEGYNPPHGNNS